MTTNAAEEKLERTQTADGYSGPRKRDFTRLKPGTLVGRYQAGEGGQGVVYHGEHLTLGYPVAIKVMHVSDSEVCTARRARFRREARLGAKLQHRHVVKVLEAGELDDASPYLVMEYVEGTSLSELIERTTLPAAAVTELGLQLLSAVAAIDDHGILHRDIKPENILLERTVDGAVMAKLLDFGVSKAHNVELASRTLTQDGTVLGTPYYMSPEQVRGKDLDVRTERGALRVPHRAAPARRPDDQRGVRQDRERAGRPGAHLGARLPGGARRGDRSRPALHPRGPLGPPAPDGGGAPRGRPAPRPAARGRRLGGDPREPGGAPRDLRGPAQPPLRAAAGEALRRARLAA